MKTSTVCLKQKLYPKEAVMKAAYHYLDRAYFHVDALDDTYVITIIAKDESDADTIQMEFENEVLAQAVRYQVYLQTHTLREVLMARAMASTIVGEETNMGTEEIPESEDALEDVLKDWFARNEA